MPSSLSACRLRADAAPALSFCTAWCFFLVGGLDNIHNVSVLGDHFDRPLEAPDQLAAQKLLGVPPSSVVIGQVSPPWIKYPCDSGHEIEMIHRHDSRRTARRCRRFLLLEI
jgi:hypothetical protein